MRKILFFILLLVYSPSLKAQETYTINEHGTYVIDSGAIAKVPFRLPTEGNISICGFWGNYAVFIYLTGVHMGIVIFNIETGSANDIFDESFFSIPEIIEYDTHLCIVLGKWNNDYPIYRWYERDNFELDYYIYKFEMESLELIEETFAGRSLYREGHLPAWENITSNRISDNIVRYSTGDKYFDVIYGPGVDMRQWEEFSVYYDRSLNRHAIFVSEYHDGK